MYTQDELIFKLIVFASCLIDFAASLAALWYVSRLRKQINLWGLLRSVAAVTLLFGLKYAVLAIIGVDGFGFIHLVYVDLTVIVPCIGLMLLIGNDLRKRRQPEEPQLLTRWVKILACLSLLGFAVFIYASEVEPFRLQLETANVSLRQGRAGVEPLKIGVVTDLQTRFVTDYERFAIKRLMEQGPDIILMPGDVFQGVEEAYESQAEALREVLATLDAPGGVYLVPGDVDQRPGRLEAIVAGTKIKLLHNDVVHVRVRDRNVTIAGVELNYDSRAAKRCVDAIEDNPETDDIRIVLGHRPDVVSRLRENSRIDLVVAGHTHGGQIVVPGFGPLMTLTDVPRKVAAGGLHSLDGNLIYVSRGVGCERHQAPRIRFFCPPELSLLTISSVN